MKLPLYKTILETLQKWRESHSRDVAHRYAAYVEYCQREGIVPKGLKTYYSWVGPHPPKEIKHDHFMALIESHMASPAELEEFWNLCRKTTLPGVPLAALGGYPVVADKNGRLSFDVDLLEKCIAHFARDPENERGAADLLYLTLKNTLPALSPQAAEQYRMLQERFPRSTGLEEAARERNEALEGYKEIVDGLGLMFTGTPIEIVLHDIRDPFHSIVALQNSITGRHIGGPTTNFGITLIKKYSRREAPKNHVSYQLPLKNGRSAKCTTIPIFHKKHELLALLCVNIEITAIKKNIENVQDCPEVAHFLRNMINIIDNTEIDERIDYVPPPENSAFP